MGFLFRLVVLVLAIVAIGAAGLWYLSSRGVSARAEPTSSPKRIASSAASATGTRASNTKTISAP